MKTCRLTVEATRRARALLGDPLKVKEYMERLLEHQDVRMAMSQITKGALVYGDKSDVCTWFVNDGEKWNGLIYTKEDLENDNSLTDEQRATLKGVGEMLLPAKASIEEWNRGAGVKNEPGWGRC